MRFCLHDSLELAKLSIVEKNQNWVASVGGMGLGKTMRKRSLFIFLDVGIFKNFILSKYFLQVDLQCCVNFYCRAK